jgi:hypothetical protein
MKITPAPPSPVEGEGYREGDISINVVWQRRDLKVIQAIRMRRLYEGGQG